ncbi:helix-turn-helix domain-containing protein [Rhodococcus ruber]
MTASELSEKTAELGYQVNRVAISKLENGNRNGKFEVAELVILAEALEIPPILLLYPDVPDGVVEYRPHLEVDSWLAINLFSGERTQEGAPRVNTAPLALMRQHDVLLREHEEAEATRAKAAALAQQHGRPSDYPADSQEFFDAREAHAELARAENEQHRIQLQLARLRDAMRHLGMTPPRSSDHLDADDQQSIFDYLKDLR